MSSKNEWSGTSNSDHSEMVYQKVCSFELSISLSCLTNVCLGL